MTYREKLYEIVLGSVSDPRPTPSLATLADWTEHAAFVALAGAVLSLAAKGISVAVGFAELLVIGVFINAFVGLLIAFLALLLLSIIIDGGHAYHQFVREQGEEVRRRV